MTLSSSSDPAKPPPFESSIPHRIAGLDELRGIAILLVLMAHFFHIASTERFHNFHLGGVGVDLFLLISGYLISKILIGQKGKPRYFRKFYIRRGFRILPLYLLAVGTVLLLGAVRGKYFPSYPFYLTFTQNYLYDPDQFAGNWVSDKYTTIPGLGPLWSLAIEEHFYLLMPLLIAVLPSRLWPACFACLTFLGIWLNCMHHHLYAPEAWNLYPSERFTHLRMQYLAMGVLLNFGSRWWIYIPLILFWGGYSYWLEMDIPIVRLAILTTLLAAIDLAIRTRWRIRNWLLARFGVLCFGVYVFHIPILIVLQPLLNKFHLSALIGVPVFLLASYVVASVSYTYFEIPIQRWRTRFE